MDNGISIMTNINTNSNSALKTLPVSLSAHQQMHFTNAYVVPSLLSRTLYNLSIWSLQTN